MRSLLIAALAVFVLIGVDAWLCIRTMTPGALAKSSIFNPLIATTGAQASPISHYGDYLL
jgi:hypothetical protein